MAGRTRFLDSRTGVSVRMAAGLVRLTHYRYFLKSARAPKIPFPAPERYYPHARIRVFHHSGTEIPGSVREGKPRSFFLCFVKIFKKVDRLSENDASSSATRKWLLLASKSLFLTSKSEMLTRKWLLLTSKSEMLASKSLFLTSKSEMLTRKWLLLTSKSEMLARKWLLLTSKSEMLTRKSLLLTSKSETLTRKWLLLTSKSEMLASRALF